MTTMETKMIDNYEDIIDSRDVIARIEQLQAIRHPGPVPEGILNVEDYDTDQDSLFAELSHLEDLAAEFQAFDAENWEYGVTLIRDSYFEAYAQELASEITDEDGNHGWPLNCIDWEKAARELRMDYTSVDFGGVTYWVR